MAVVAAVRECDNGQRHQHHLSQQALQNITSLQMRTSSIVTNSKDCISHDRFLLQFDIFLLLVRVVRG